MSCVIFTNTSVRQQFALLLFFFQAEDGIRDLTVTGVQTCALPIYCRGARGAEALRRDDRRGEPRARRLRAARAGPTDGAARARLHDLPRSERTPAAARPRPLGRSAADGGDRARAHGGGRPPPSPRGAGRGPAPPPRGPPSRAVRERAGGRVG